ncbi:hypothetical protein OC835_006243, partial [Tilletia horrida]
EQRLYRAGGFDGLIEKPVRENTLRAFFDYLDEVDVAKDRPQSAGSVDSHSSSTSSGKDRGDDGSATAELTAILKSGVPLIAQQAITDSVRNAVFDGGGVGSSPAAASHVLEDRTNCAQPTAAATIIDDSNATKSGARSSSPTQRLVRSKSLGADMACCLNRSFFLALHNKDPIVLPPISPTLPGAESPVSAGGAVLRANSPSQISCADIQHHIVDESVRSPHYVTRGFFLLHDAGPAGPSGGVMAAADERDPDDDGVVLVMDPHMRPAMWAGAAWAKGVAGASCTAHSICQSSNGAAADGIVSGSGAAAQALTQSPTAITSATCTSPTVRAPAVSSSTKSSTDTTPPLPPPRHFRQVSAAPIDLRDLAEVKREVDLDSFALEGSYFDVANQVFRRVSGADENLTEEELRAGEDAEPDQGAQDNEEEQQEQQEQQQHGPQQESQHLVDGNVQRGGVAAAAAAPSSASSTGSATSSPCATLRRTAPSQKSPTAPSKAAAMGTNQHAGKPASQHHHHSHPSSIMSSHFSYAAPASSDRGAVVVDLERELELELQDAAEAAAAAAAAAVGVAVGAETDRGPGLGLGEPAQGASLDATPVVLMQTSLSAPSNLLPFAAFLVQNADEDAETGAREEEEQEQTVLLPASTMLSPSPSPSPSPSLSVSDSEPSISTCGGGGRDGCGSSAHQDDGDGEEEAHDAAHLFCYRRRTSVSISSSGYHTSATSHEGAGVVAAAASSDEGHHRSHSQKMETSPTQTSTSTMMPIVSEQCAAEPKSKSQQEEAEGQRLPLPAPRRRRAPRPGSIDLPAFHFPSALSWRGPAAVAAAAGASSSASGAVSPRSNTSASAGTGTTAGLAAAAAVIAALTSSASHPLGNGHGHGHGHGHAFTQRGHQQQQQQQQPSGGGGLFARTGELCVRSFASLFLSGTSSGSSASASGSSTGGVLPIAGGKAARQYRFSAGPPATASATMHSGFGTSISSTSGGSSASASASGPGSAPSGLNKAFARGASRLGLGLGFRSMPCTPALEVRRNPLDAESPPEVEEEVVEVVKEGQDVVELLDAAAAAAAIEAGGVGLGLLPLPLPLPLPVASAEYDGIEGGMGMG